MHGDAVSDGTDESGWSGELPVHLEQQFMRIGLYISISLGVISLASGVFGVALVFLAVIIILELSRRRYRSLHGDTHCVLTAWTNRGVSIKVVDALKTDSGHYRWNAESDIGELSLTGKGDALEISVDDEVYIANRDSVCLEAEEVLETLRE